MILIILALVIAYVLYRQALTVLGAIIGILLVIIAALIRRRRRARNAQNDQGGDQ